SIDEDDRHLGDAEAAPHGAPGHLDLARVALRLHAAEVDRLERLAPPRLVAAREIAARQPEDRAAVEAAAFAQDVSAGPPALDAAAGDVARAEDDVGARVERGEEVTEVARVVRQIRVHLHE